MKKITGFLRLTRPANIITAISDVLAGVAIAGTLISVTWGFAMSGPVSFGKLILEQPSMGTIGPILLLLLSTIGLYGGGVVLNDVFDAELDKKERPERPIPSGLISRTAAAIFGILLLLGGILAAAMLTPSNLFSTSTQIAIAIAIIAVAYDKRLKHNKLLGPLAMGACRGLNLLLGISIAPFALQFFWGVAVVPVVYIAAITMISRGEVHGGKSITLYIAGIFYAAVILAILWFAKQNHHIPTSLPFLLLSGILIYPPLRKAISNPAGPQIGKAVKSGVLGLIAMNAAWSAAFGDLYFAALILLLLPLSMWLAKRFAVT